MRNDRCKINKHLGNNFKAHQLACKAINIGGTVRDGLTTYSYDKDTNTLIVSDGLVCEAYHPKILDDDLIFPFSNRVVNYMM